MADIIMLAITFTFIAICVAYIGWCDRIIGPDDADVGPTQPGDADADAVGITTGVTS